MSSRFLVMLPLFMMMAVSCKHDDELDGPYHNGGVGETVVYADDLKDFDISFDYSTYDESETVPSSESDESYNDYLENSKFDKQVTIVYNGDDATVTTIDGVEYTKSGAHVVINSTKKVEYVVSGTTSDGSLKIYSEDKFELTLNNVSITNKSGAAINIQTKKRCFCNLPEGTVSSLTDGSSYSQTVDGEDEKGCIFSEGQIVFSGKGTLEITANAKNAICSDQYVRTRPGVNLKMTVKGSNGIKANDAIIIGGGVLNINVSAAAGKGLKCEAYTTFTGGRTTIISSGNPEYDSEDKELNASCGVKSDSLFKMNGGQLLVKCTGSGAKGISCDTEFEMNGGRISVVTTGSAYNYSNDTKSPKGIKVDGLLTVNGGNVVVRSDNSEGIESKSTLTINDGQVEVYAGDDAINASKKSGTNGQYIQNGGYVFACSSSNDGLDANGTITVTDGVLYGVGSMVPEEGIDCDNNTFAITGGVVVGVGGSYSSPTEKSCSQPSLVYGGSLSISEVIALSSASGDNIVAVTGLGTYNGSVSVLMSSAEMEKGSTYSLVSAATLSDAVTDFHGLLLGGSVSSGSSTSLTLSSMVTKTGSSSGGFGGGPNGMR